MAVSSISTFEKAEGALAPSTSVHSKAYRKDIDGLRAIAVISVIINHLYSGVLPGGYLGVDVFFVISGYVITLSFERTGHLSLRQHLLQFYSRRIKRLVPALLAMVLITSATVRLFNPEAMVSTLTGMASIFGFANFFLFTQAINYFGASAQLNPFNHTWSLGVEEQFYFFFPFLIRWQSRTAALAILSAASLLMFIATYDTNQPAAYFLIPFRFWELGIGCLLALATSKGGGSLTINAAIPILAAAAAMFLAKDYPIVCTVVVVISTAMLIGSVRHGTVVYRLLSNRVASYVGKISYSLYLWHWPVICISHWTVGIHLWSLPLQIAAMLLLSIASYHLIENPFRRTLWIGGRWGVLAAGLPLMVATAFLILLGQRYSIPSFSGDKTAETGRGVVPGYVGKYTKRKLTDCSAVSIGSDEGFERNLAKCTAELSGKPKLIFVGDSHAADMFPMAEEIYRDGLASVLNVFQTGCRTPPIVGEPDYCKYPQLIMKHVSSNDRNILVIRNNYSPRRLDGSLTAFSHQLEELLSESDKAGLKVIYVLPAPKYNKVGPTGLCSRQWYRPDWAMSAECHTGIVEDRNEQLARRRDVTDYLLGLSRTRSSFFVFDPFDALCGGPTGDCTPVRNGRVVYRDDSHLTEEGSEILTAPFEAFLSSHGLITPRS
ncbi:acyltransferase [Mesorhizobium sp. M0028]|uniref:acyltransferase family protein n=1 Tax=Mesorhizobium sp. M0028 TaxID=2956849 RepID=UPI0033385418